MAFVPGDFNPTFEIPMVSKRKNSKKAPQRPRDEALQVLAELVKHPFVTWCQDNPEDVRREPWRGLAGNLVAACDGYPDLLEMAREAFHYVSQGASSYRPADCDREFDHAAESVEAAGPLSWAHCIAHGVPEEVCTGEKNLISERTAWRKQR